MANSVYGVGINDSNFTVQPTVNGKQVALKSYSIWKSMLMRCYKPEWQVRNPTYIGCSVDPEWHSFRNFSDWYEEEFKETDWQLDKDLLLPGNKVYRKDLCIFVPKSLNSFCNEYSRGRGECLIGATWHKKNQKFMSKCNNPFTRKAENLGYYETELEAHLAWKRRKHELSCQYADTVHDDRLAASLRKRYK